MATGTTADVAHTNPKRERGSDRPAWPAIPSLTLRVGIRGGIGLIPAWDACPDPASWL